MNKLEVNELKKRFTKNGCTITKMCGCYVDGEKNRLVDINETFLNLDEDEFHKYLDIAKKTLSGKLGNNLLNLSFPTEEERQGGRQHFLMALRESKLKNEELLERFYELIINTYDSSENYLILIFHDAYDVMRRTSDRNELDESEEVYEYLLCAICPVILSKPGLGYREAEHRIGSRVRDWIVGAPESGFLFPAFNDRSSDIHNLLFYTKNTKEPHFELMEQALACEAEPTGTIQKQNFDNIMQKGLGAQTAENEMLYINIQENLNDMLNEQIEVFAQNSEDYLLDEKQLDILMQDCEIPEENADIIKSAYVEAFAEKPPMVEHLIDQRSLKNNALKKEKMELVKQVAALSQQINESIADEKELIPAMKTDSIVVKAKPEKMEQIMTEKRNGQTYMIIPINEHDDIILKPEENSELL